MSVNRTTSSGVRICARESAAAMTGNCQEKLTVAFPHGFAIITFRRMQMPSNTNQRVDVAFFHLEIQVGNRGKFSVAFAGAVCFQYDFGQI